MAATEVKATVWVGAMWQKIQQKFAGTVDDSRLDPVGGQSVEHARRSFFESGRQFGRLVEGGIGPRKSYSRGSRVSLLIVDGVAVKNGRQR